MTAWVRALLDPRTVARRVRLNVADASAPSLLALLTLGQFDGFLRIAPRYGFQTPEWVPEFPSKDSESKRPQQLSQVDSQILLSMLDFVGSLSDCGRRTTLDEF